MLCKTVRINNNKNQLGICTDSTEVAFHAAVAAAAAADDDNDDAVAAVAAAAAADDDDDYDDDDDDDDYDDDDDVGDAVPELSTDPYGAPIRSKDGATLYQGQ